MCDESDNIKWFEKAQLLLIMLNVLHMLYSHKWDERINVYTDLEITRKEVVMIYFKVLFWYKPGGGGGGCTADDVRIVFWNKF
jgi:hypothetical protein